jgi:Sulfotransferase family
MSSPDPVSGGGPVVDFDFSDRPYVASRLIRRSLFELRAARRPGARAALAQLGQPAQQSRMVFVVGAARSGTTALQDGLSASDNAFVLGEAFFFWDNLRPGFRARHNAKRRRFDLPAGKLYECPAVAPEDATWVEVVAALASRYRLVGDKIPIGGYKEGRWPSEMLAFHRRHFPGAAYILAFRNPRDAIVSPRTTWGVRNLVPWARSYIAAQRALIRLRLHFPRSVPVFLERVGPDTFEAIERCLGCPAPLLASRVHRVAASAQDAQQVPPELRQTVEDLERLYPSLCDTVAGFAVASSIAPLSSIDARLAELYRRLDPLYYSIDARLQRLRSKVTTASRMARNMFQQTAF